MVSYQTIANWHGVSGLWKCSESFEREGLLKLYAERSRVDVNKAISNIMRALKWLWNGLATLCIERGNGGVVQSFS